MQAEATVDVLVHLRDLREGFNPEPIATCSHAQLRALALLSSEQYRHPFYWAGFGRRERAAGAGTRDAPASFPDVVP